MLKIYQTVFFSRLHNNLSGYLVEIEVKIQCLTVFARFQLMIKKLPFSRFLIIFETNFYNISGTALQMQQLFWDHEKGSLIRRNAIILLQPLEASMGL